MYEGRGWGLILVYGGDGVTWGCHRELSTGRRGVILVYGVGRVNISVWGGLIIVCGDSGVRG